MCQLFEKQQQCKQCDCHGDLCESASAAQADLMVKYYYIIISKNYLYVLPNSMPHGQ